MAAGEPLFPSPTEAAAWAAELPPGAFGREVFDYRGTVGSTQDLAFEAAESGAPHGAVFIAEEQTTGRGRQGSDWSAPAFSSLLLSVLLRPAPPPGDLARTALGAGLAACRAVEKICALHPDIKWPNDLLLNGRKTGGVLVESRKDFASLGVGLNVLQEPGDFPAELLGRATSLADETGDRPDRLWLLAMLLMELGRLFGPAGEGWDSVRLEVARRLAWRGRRVRVGAFCGAVIGLDDSGRLTLRTESGEELPVVSGSLELVET
jgi:BirA family biotin operon repressor/biotin-[acetyl-CoA-carboxylase] ligase